MANEEHLAILSQGVEIWNKWRRDNPDIQPDLSEADLIRANLFQINLFLADLSNAKLNRANLKKANLVEAHLTFAHLTNAVLTEADLTMAKLYGADLTMADLGLADLRWVDLRSANLYQANLAGARLIEANLSFTNLRGAKFQDSTTGKTVFAEVDLSQVSGLETVKHQAPSTIGIDTLYKSKGEIPVEFLRSAGVPEELIDYLPNLITGKAIQYYSCFISYSTKDQDFAERLHADLQSRGVRCWFAPEDIKGGHKLHEQIPAAIRLHDKLLLVLSENSMNSEWVKTEIYHARQDEIRDKRRKLFPISLVDFKVIRQWQAFDADSGKDMAREIREYYLPDFSRWEDPEAYQKAFDRLLRDLNLDAEE
ncbi:MAG TPA: toll/interleukin-1 receptor domain-containing protein [Anaerolineales bacterium]|nr:toll/interleukin-1 receptor domain-containing protein [Anaerolineales bacterium]